MILKLTYLYHSRFSATIAFQKKNSENIKIQCVTLFLGSVTFFVFFSWMHSDIIFLQHLATTGVGVLGVNRKISMQSVSWPSIWLMIRLVFFLYINFKNDSVSKLSGLSHPLVVVLFHFHHWHPPNSLQNHPDSITMVEISADQHEDESIL